MTWIVLTAVLMVTLAIWIHPASGEAPVITGPYTAKISDTSDSVMIPNYKVTDADGDDIKYAFDNNAATLTGSGITVEIVEATGLITAKDVTVANDKYTLSITTDNDAAVTQEITVSVFTDTDGPTIADSVTTVSIAEDDALAKKGSSVGITIKPEDPDTIKGDGFTYELSGTNAADFAMDLFTGATKTTKDLTEATYSLEVSVKDSKRTEVKKAISITVTADIAPVCNPTTYSKSLPSGTKVDTDVVTLTCTDASTLTYTKKSGDDNGDFKVDSATGAMKVAKELDYNTTKSYTINVEAKDAASQAATVTVTVTVTESVSGSGSGSGSGSENGATQTFPTLTFFSALVMMTYITCTIF